MAQVSVPNEIDVRKYIDASKFGDRPHIRDRRIPVATIAHSAQSQGWGVAELAYQFTLSESQVLAALLFYEEHKDVIESQEALYQAELDADYERYNREKEF